jgi:hypothetical protein
VGATARTFPLDPDTALVFAPDNTQYGDYAYYVVRKFRADGRHYVVRGCRVAGSRVPGREPGEVFAATDVYGPTTQEGVRAFFAGRRHNLGGTTATPRLEGRGW